MTTYVPVNPAPMRVLPDVGSRIRTLPDETREIRLATMKNRLVKRYITPGDLSECWPWHGGVIDEDGYSRMWWGRSRMGGHRAAYLAFIGDVPDGLVLDHLCRNRICANPWHLEPVTSGVNTRRGDTPSNRTHCTKGHPYSGENLAIHHKRIGGDAYRACKQCCRDKQKRRYHERKALRG